MGFIDRLQNECDDLHEKITKLESFIDSDFQGVDISTSQSELLNDQLKAMVVYYDILLNRLSDLQSRCVKIIKEFRNLSDIGGKENYTFIKGNITEESFIEKLFYKHQFVSVIHLAAE